MDLNLCSDIDSYNRFVASHPQGSFLQLWEWGQWQESLGKKVYRFFVMEESKILLSAQVLKMPLPFRTYYLYVPYGPLVSTDLIEQTLKFFIGIIKQRFPEAIFLKLEPKNALPILGKKSGNVQPGSSLLVDLSSSEDQLQKNMHTKTRYNIKVAQRHGVKVVSDLVVTPGFGLYLKEAVDLIINTTKRQGYKGYNLEHYKNFVDFFAKRKTNNIQISVYRALHEENLLASAIMVDTKTVRTYLFGGSSEENREVMANYLLHWQAILDAKEKELKIYDFWGAETSSGKTPGFVRFKLGFGGKEIKYSGSWDVALRRVWYNFYNLIKKLYRILP